MVLVQLVVLSVSRLVSKPKSTFVAGLISALEKQPGDLDQKKRWVGHADKNLDRGLDLSEQPTAWNHLGLRPPGQSLCYANISVRDIPSIVDESRSFPVL